MTENLPEQKRRARLRALETAIETKAAEIGKALEEIRDTRLYQEQGFETFEAYLHDRWGISRATAYERIGYARAIEMSAVADIRGPGAIMNWSRRAVREITPLLDDANKFHEAMTRAAEIAGDGKTPTFEQARQARREVEAPARPERVTRPDPDPSPAADRAINLSIAKRIIDELATMGEFVAVAEIARYAYEVAGLNTWEIQERS
jgi:hypothetical protein